eukprot:RCo012514
MTTDELALLVEGTAGEVLEELRARSAAGETLDVVLEELAAEHMFESLRCDARFCSAVMRRRVGLRDLAPTECIPGLFVPGQSSQNCIRRSSTRAFVCRSGAAAWFEEKLMLQALPPRLFLVPRPPPVPKIARSRPSPLSFPDVQAPPRRVTLAIPCQSCTASARKEGVHRVSLPALFPPYVGQSVEL